MQRIRILSVAAALFAVLGAAPLALAETEPAAATAAYRAAFGSPPGTEGVRCRAAVVFLPGMGRSGSPGRLGPVPLISVSPDRIVEQAARVVVEGYPERPRFLAVPPAFPPGSRLLGVDIRDETATVRVAPGAGTPHPLALHALALTLTQFDGISAVALALEGREPGPATGPRTDLAEPPGPPRLIDVLSTRSPDQAPAEIDVLFDRPVEVLELWIAAADGTPVPGRLYTSMFDMAAVLRPGDPGVIREGLPLRVRWEVKDRKGRHGRGERQVTLRIYQHRKAP